MRAAPAGVVTGASGVVVTSRTFAADGDGTRGHLVPSLGEEALVGLVDGPVTALGLASNDRTVTAVGWLNASAEPGTAAMRLIGSSGEVLGEASYGLEPWRTSFIGDVFAKLEVPAQANARVELEVVEGGAMLLGGVVVEDLRSGDTVYVPATPRPGPRVKTVEIDTRREVLEVDLLEQAVGYEALPAGTHVAEVVGGGDLGADYLPLRALCVYRHTSGVLRTAVVGPGETVEDIAGGEPFWCVVPDWIRADDNTGTLEVRLSGGGGARTLDLDARSNCVLLDRQPAAEISVRPGPAYTVAAAGHLGDGLSPPQALVMFKAHASGELRVVAVGDGERLDGVAPWSQLLAVVVDLDASLARSGTVALRPALP